MTLLTDKETARMQKDAQVAQRYAELQRDFPEATRNRIVNQIVKEGGFGFTSASGVYFSLKRSNTIER